MLVPPPACTPWMRESTWARRGPIGPSGTMTDAVSENVTIEKSSVGSSLSTAASAALFASSIA